VLRREDRPLLGRDRGTALSNDCHKAGAFIIGVALRLAAGSMQSRGGAVNF
jgi:hypothetical protein